MGYKFYPTFALMASFILFTLIAICCIVVRKNKGKSFFGKNLTYSYILSLYISFIASYFWFPITLVHREYFKYPQIDVEFYPFVDKFLFLIILIFIPIGILIGILINKVNKFKVLIYSILIPSFLFFIDYLLILYEVKQPDFLNIYVLIISILSIYISCRLYNVKYKINMINKKSANFINNIDKNSTSFLAYLFEEYF